MVAHAEPLGWSAYCDECRWESQSFTYKRGAEKAAEQHNEDHHPDEDTIRARHVGNLADPALTGYDNRVVVCDECREIWPCPTIRGIENHQGEE